MRLASFIVVGKDERGVERRCRVGWQKQLEDDPHCFVLSCLLGGFDAAAA